MADDIIELLLEDHRKFRTLLDELTAAPAGEREELFRHLVAELASHEAAEESLVHPTLREMPDGEATADAVLEEEKSAERLLADMEKMDTDSDEFADAAQKLAVEVDRHADHEEREEFTRMRDHLSAERRQELAAGFSKLKEMGPTHPHPKTPQAAEVRAVAGPVAGIFDRARDAARDLMSS